MNGSRGKLVNVVSGVSQENVLGPLLFLIYILEIYSIPENKLISYDDDSTSILKCLICMFWAVIQFDSIRVAVAESLNCDLGKVSEWCDLL